MGGMIICPLTMRYDGGVTNFYRATPRESQHPSSFVLLDTCIK